MTELHTILSKEIRDDFIIKLHYDEVLGPEDNPRADQDNISRIHIWKELTSLSDNQDIRGYEEALYELYRKVYPELVEYIMEDDPPEEIMDLVEQTPYPGALRWITIRDGQEMEIKTSQSADPDNRYLSGVAFIGDEDLDKEGYTREEGEAIIENDIIMIQEYVNGNVFFINIDLEDETECIGGIYALEEAGNVGRITRQRGCHIPREEDLDEIIMEAAPTGTDREQIKEATWK